MDKYRSMTYWELFRNTTWLKGKARYVIPDCLSAIWDGVCSLGTLLLFLVKLLAAVVVKPIATYKFYKKLRESA